MGGYAYHREGHDPKKGWVVYKTVEDKYGDVIDTEYVTTVETEDQAKRFVRHAVNGDAESPAPSHGGSQEGTPS